jgi:hypothetical protein
MRNLIGLILIFQITLSFSRDTLISTTIPYATGTVHLNVENDTVSFSNGVKIFSLVFSIPFHIPEEELWEGGIAFSYSSGTIVYRNASEMVTKWIVLPEPSLERPSEIRSTTWKYTIGNPDTIWPSASSIPLVTYPGDSLFLHMADTDFILMTVKHLYNSHMPVAEIVNPIATHRVPNTNAIIYFLSSSRPNSNMKFQVASIDIDSTPKVVPNLGTFSNSVASGITIRWAIDSLGNGLFPQSTLVVKTSKNTARATAEGPNRYVTLNKSNHNIVKHNGVDERSNRAFFSLRGEKGSGTKSNGVFIKP